MISNQLEPPGPRHGLPAPVPNILAGTRDSYPSCVRQARAGMMRCCCASDTWHVTVPAVLMSEPPLGLAGRGQRQFGEPQQLGIPFTELCEQTSTPTPHLHQQFGEGTL